MLKKVVHSLSLDLWLLFLQSISISVSIRIDLCACILDMIPSIPFSLNRCIHFLLLIYHDMVGSHPYLRNCMSLISKQDNLSTVVGLFLSHSTRPYRTTCISFKIGNRSEESISYNNGSFNRVSQRCCDIYLNKQSSSLHIDSLSFTKLLTYT